MRFLVEERKCRLLDMLYTGNSVLCGRSKKDCVGRLSEIDRRGQKANANMNKADAFE